MLMNHENRNQQLIVKQSIVPGSYCDHNILPVYLHPQSTVHSYQVPPPYLFPLLLIQPLTLSPMRFPLSNVTWLLRKANFWVVTSFTVPTLPLVPPSSRNLPLLAQLSYPFPLTRLVAWAHMPQNSCSALALWLTGGPIPPTAAAALTLAHGPARIICLLPRADALWSLSYPNRFYGLSYHTPTPSAWARQSLGPCHVTGLPYSLLCRHQQTGVTPLACSTYSSSYPWSRFHTLLRPPLCYSSSTCRFGRFIVSRLPLQPYLIYLLVIYYTSIRSDSRNYVQRNVGLLYQVLATQLALYLLYTHSLQQLPGYPLLATSVRSTVPGASYLARSLHTEKLGHYSREIWYQVLCQVPQSTSYSLRSKQIAYS